MILVNHAEINAIVNRTESSLDNCTMFVTAFPCMECAKLIVQSGIKRVVYLEESTCQKQTDEQKSATKRLFDLSKVQLVQLE